VPFVDSVVKAQDVAERINRAAAEDGRRPIVFASLVKDEVRAVLLGANGLILDFFEAYLGRLEAELESRSTHTLRRHHGIDD
jgi:regulator of PEP synthase PpsR (kinase-PPPase family)